MRDLVSHSANGIGIAPTLPLPNLPPSVERYLHSCAAYAAARARFAAASPEERELMHLGSAPERYGLTEAERVQAKGAREYLGRLLQPIALPALRVWLGPVNVACRNPQSPTDFAMRTMALHEMLGDLPQGAFTADARRALPEFFPSAADISKAVGSNVRRLQDVDAALVHATALPRGEASRPAGRTPPTPEEIAAVKASVQAFMAERNVATAKAAEEKPPNPAHLNDLQRLASYDAAVREGGVFAEASKTMADAIRRKLAAQTEAQPQQDAAE